MFNKTLDEEIEELTKYMCFSSNTFSVSYTNRPISPNGYKSSLTLDEKQRDFLYQQEYYVELDKNRQKKLEKKSLIEELYEREIPSKIRFDF